MTDQACGYESIRDPAELRIAIRELSRVGDWLRQCAAIAAEAPDMSMERAAGVAASAAAVGRLRAQAVARLATMSAGRSAGEVVLVDPRTAPVLPSSPGVSEIAVVGEATVEVTVQPGHATVPRSRPHDVAVLTLVGRVSVLWWDLDGCKHQREVPRHHHAVIPAGVTFAVYNEGLLTSTAVLYRSTVAGAVPRDYIDVEIRESSPAESGPSSVDGGGRFSALALRTIVTT